MERREYEILSNYYYGIGKTELISIEDIKKLDQNQMIKKIYEVIDNDYNEVWYLIKDIKNKNYILKSKCGNSYAINIIKGFENKYKFYKIATDLIKMFNSNIDPIVFKVNENNFMKYSADKSNINNAFFNNYYCQVNNVYKAIREYRNKVEMEVFEKEEDAIYWCSNFNITKELILSNNLRPFDLYKRVYNYNF